MFVPKEWTELSSTILTDLDLAGQKQIFCFKKSVKKHNALLKIAKNLHCLIFQVRIKMLKNKKKWNSKVTKWDLC
jgi:hypothetical protein